MVGWMGARAGTPRVSDAGGRREGAGGTKDARDDTRNNNNRERERHTLKRTRLRIAYLRVAPSSRFSRFAGLPSGVGPFFSPLTLRKKKKTHFDDLSRTPLSPRAAAS